MKPSWILLLAACLAGCSSSSTEKQTKAAPAPTASKSANPVAKYIELVGFRIKEKSPGHLEVHFAVVNHSEADIGDLNLTINLSATTAKPGDAPLVTFTAKVPALGPEELKAVTAEATTKLRVYELPDWQFLKADFQITE